MKKAVATGATAIALLLAACSDVTGGDTTAPPQEPTDDPTVTDEPTESPPEEPTDEPTDEPGDEGQRTEAVPFDSDVDLRLDSDIPVAVTWQTPGETLHVYTQGSSTDGCYTEPIEAWTDGEMMEIDFEPARIGQACTADVVTHAWTIEWDEPFEVTEPMPLVLNDVRGLGQSLEDRELPPEPTEPLA